MKNKYGEIVSRQWKPVCLEGVRLLTTSYRDYQFPNHFHEYYSFLSVRSGVNEGFTEKTKYRFDAGAILTISPGQVHAGNSYKQRPLTFDVLHIEPEVLSAWAAKQKGISKMLNFDIAPYHSKTVCNAFDLLCNAIRLSESSLEVDELLDDFLAALVNFDDVMVSRTQHKYVSKPYIDRAIDYLRQHHSRDIRLDELSTAACISPFHLIRQFRNQIGLSPFQYLRNYRVEIARKSLNQPGRLASIGTKVGFYDESHFIRNFTQVMGISPSSYRKGCP